MTAQAGNANERLKAILKAGKLFEGKYRILRPLGAGSFAVVVHARHEVMGRDVALKFLKPKVVSGNPEVSERFVKEVQIASRLKHPNVVAIYDFGVTDDGIYYMVQEFVDGKTVDQLFPEGRPMAQNRVLDMLGQVLSCLGEAHRQGVIHRDLKPSNLMSTTNKEGAEVVKILDFGVAKLLEPSSASPASQVRQSTKFIGTPIYMSPEQILGREVTPASDLYSVGLMSYEMLTGQPPIQAEQIAEVVQQHLSDSSFDFPLLHLLEPHLQKAILKATSREASERFQNAEEFQRALSQEDEEEVSGSTEVMDARDIRGMTSSEDELDVFLGKNYISNDDSIGYQTFAPLSPEEQRQMRYRSTEELNRLDLLNYEDSLDDPREDSLDSLGSLDSLDSLGGLGAMPDEPSISRRGAPQRQPASVPSYTRPPVAAEKQMDSIPFDAPRRTPIPASAPAEQSALSGSFRAKPADRSPSTSGIHRVQPEKTSVTASQKLELDMSVVHSVRQQRNRMTMENRTRVRQEHDLDSLQKDDATVWSLVLVVLGGLAFFVNLILLTAVTDGMGSGARLLIGFLPLIGSLVLVAFQSKQNDGMMARWLEPLGIRLLVALFASIVLVALFSSNQASISLRHEGAWLWGLLPDIQLFKIFGKLSQSIANGLAVMFDVLAKIMPW